MAPLRTAVTTAAFRRAIQRFVPGGGKSTAVGLVVSTISSPVQRLLSQSPVKAVVSKKFTICHRRDLARAIRQPGPEVFAQGRHAPLPPALPIPRLDCIEHSRGSHCGNIHVRLWVSKRPETIRCGPARARFSRSHRPRIVADLEGLFEVWADDRSLVERIPFRHPHLRFSDLSPPRCL